MTSSVYKRDTEPWLPVFSEHCTSEFYKTLMKNGGGGFFLQLVQLLFFYYFFYFCGNKDWKDITSDNSCMPGIAMECTSWLFWMIYLSTLTACLILPCTCTYTLFIYLSTLTACLIHPCTCTYTLFICSPHCIQILFSALFHQFCNSLCMIIVQSIHYCSQNKIN